MSLQPLMSDKSNKTWYGENGDDETKPLVVASIDKINPDVDVDVAELLHSLFLAQNANWNDLDANPKTNPKLCPERRFKRHRNYYIYQLNQFRHWWKTSRLLVRLSGGYELCLNATNWDAMGAYNVIKRKQA